MNKNFEGYVNNIAKVGKIKKQLAELGKEIDHLELAFDFADGNVKIEKAIGQELHELRIKKLGLMFTVNDLERKLLQFELDSELAE